MGGRGAQAGSVTGVASRDYAARWLVWSVFLAVLVLLAWQVGRAGSRIPLGEDWLVVAPLTGHEPNLARWLWAQNNEHRIPLPRLLLLWTLRASGGDYRAVHWLSVTLLAATSAGLIAFMRRLRGRTDAADAFFPLVLLHFGHSNQLLFAWQIAFVLATMLSIAIGCALFSQDSVASRGSAMLAGIALLLLPFCGLNGLLFVPVTAIFLGWAGWACWSGTRGWPSKRGIGGWLLLSAVGAVALSALYFVGYQHPWWNPPNPGFVVSFKTALKVLALGFGPAAQFWWTPAAAAAVVLFAASLWRAARTVSGRTAVRREHAVGAALFLVNAIAFAWLLGWGRAGYVPEYGIPIRYVLPVVPAVIFSYSVWAAFDASAIGRVVQRSLAVVMLILVPVNTVAGHRLFADWYREGMARVEGDLDAGTPIEQLAIRHRDFLVHWWTPQELERQMRWLHEAGVEPFDRAAVKAR